MEILGMLDVPLAAILVPLLLLLLYIYVRWPYSTWKNLGIPGPEPSAFFGNLGSFRKLGGIQSFEAWRKKYGRTYGAYFARDPLLVTSDKEIVKEVLVKQFNNFAYRQVNGDVIMDDFTKLALFFANGSPWKRYRHLMTPAFSSGKLKALLGYMDKCSRTLTEILEEMAKAGQDVDLKDTYSRFTVDVIAGTAFGTDTNAQRGRQTEQQRLVKAMYDLLATLSSSSLSFVLAATFPFLRTPLLAMGFTPLPQKPVQYFRSTIEALIRERDQNPASSQKRVDFLQQLLALRMDGGQAVSNGVGDAAKNGNDKYLTEKEVLAQAWIVFIAGFETTASTLRYLTYNLATNPESQEKLYNEIMDVIGDGEVTYEKLNELTYLECAITETLRMCPPVIFIGRKAAETVTIKGITIPKGTGVVIPIYSTTHDPEYYPEPDKFRPERFQKEQDSLLSALPFGFGPRQCIGMRLALLEIKVAAVHLLRKVKVVPCATTPQRLVFRGDGLLAPEAPLYVKSELRQ